VTSADHHVVDPLPEDASSHVSDDAADVLDGDGLGGVSLVVRASCRTGACAVAPEYATRLSTFTGATPSVVDLAVPPRHWRMTAVLRDGDRTVTFEESTVCTPDPPWESKGSPGYGGATYAAGNTRSRPCQGSRCFGRAPPSGRVVYARFRRPHNASAHDVTSASDETVTAST